MDAAPAGLSLVVPAFNEASNLRATVAEADAALAAAFPSHEIVLVDDGSADDTPAICRELAAKYPHLRVVRFARNRGYGAALRTGFETAKLPLVAFTDADGQFDLAELGLLASYLGHESTAQIACGYRHRRRDPLKRRVLSRGYNLLVRALLNTRVRDCDCALKVFRRAAVLKLLPKSRGFFVNAEMLSRAAKLGLAVIESPVTHKPRRAGASTVSMREVPKTLRTLLSFWWAEVVCGGKLDTLSPVRHVIAARLSRGMLARPATPLPPSPVRDRVAPAAPPTVPA